MSVKARGIPQERCAAEMEMILGGIPVTFPHPEGLVMLIGEVYGSAPPNAQMEFHFTTDSKVSHDV